MARSLAQLMERALEVKEAVLVNENTALRVGSLFADIITYLEDFGSNELTTIRVRQDAIEDIVTNNYNTFLSFRNSVQGDLDAIDADIRSKYTEFATWRVQTDTYISQYAYAQDSQGHLVSMSQILQTAESVSATVSALTEEGLITQGNISLYLQDFVDENDVNRLISVAEISADKIKFNVNFDWTVTNGSNQTIFRLNKNGDLVLGRSAQIGSTTIPPRTSIGGSSSVYIDQDDLWMGRMVYHESSPGSSTIVPARSDTFSVGNSYANDYFVEIDVHKLITTTGVDTKALKVVGKSYFDGDTTINGDLTVTGSIINSGGGTTVTFPVYTSAFTLPANAEIGTIVFNPAGNNVTAPSGETIVSENSSSSSPEVYQGYAYFYLKMNATQWKVYNCH